MFLTQLDFLNLTVWQILWLEILTWSPWKRKAHFQLTRWKHTLVLKFIRLHFRVLILGKHSLLFISYFVITWHVLVAHALLRWIKEWVLVTCGVLWLDLVFSSIFLYFNLRPLCLRPKPLWNLNTPFFRSRDQPRP